jgi:hypothetical protein
MINSGLLTARLKKVLFRVFIINQNRELFEKYFIKGASNPAPGWDVALLGNGLLTAASRNRSSNTAQAHRWA